MMKLRNNNNNKEKKKNVIANAGVDPNNRYCRYCNVKLVLSRTEKGVYICPVCNVANKIGGTKPQERLVTTFASFDPNTSPEKKLVYQGSEERLSRSQYFVNKQLKEKNKELEQQDPFLKMLMQKNDIKITSTEYYSYDDYYYEQTRAMDD